MLGVIADDFTGASDIASFLVENGVSTIQVNGVPKADFVVDNKEYGAVVVSLKSRSIEPSLAITQSLEALKWLQNNGATQFYFKYCSTFDSTSKGNIGPVTDALLEALGEDFTVVTPALPINGRTIFNGYLFVGDLLLSESGMKNHPITPMKDANLVRLMDAQSQGKTTLVGYADVILGEENIRNCFTKAKQQGFRYVVVDAVENKNLDTLAKAVSDMKLVTGGSGLGAYMAKNIAANKMDNTKAKNIYIPNKDKTLILSGSCSVMTNKQVNSYKSIAPTFYLNIADLMANENYLDEVERWVEANLDKSYPPLVYATVNTEHLAKIQAEFGQEQASLKIEQAFSELAFRLVGKGVRNIITAGGETSSAVVQRLAITSFAIGKQIAAGVPWLKVLDSNLSLALKSGNFGGENFFAEAFEMML